MYNSKVFNASNLHPIFVHVTNDVPVQQQRPASLSERMRLELNGGIENEDAGTPRGQRRMMETWIVLELCNRGSLQVHCLA